MVKRFTALTLLLWLLVPVVLVAQFIAGSRLTGVNGANGPSIQNLAVEDATVNAYDKVEFSFTLSTAYGVPDLTTDLNPYVYLDATDTVAANSGASVDWVGANGVSVDLTITSGPQTFTAPCFFMVGYQRTQVSSQELLGRTNDGDWRCRTAFRSAGTYNGYIQATSAAGTGASMAIPAITVSPSANRGYVQASGGHFVHSDGSSFKPNCGDRQWPDLTTLKRSYDYEETFATWSTYKINCTRMWINATFAIALEGANDASWHPRWLRQGTTFGGHNDIEVQTANVRTGLRALDVTSGNGAYQRLSLASSSSTYRLSFWMKTASATDCQALVKADSTQYNTGTTLGSTSQIDGTTSYTQYQTTFTPNDSSVTLNFVSSGGDCYVDDVQFGPDTGSTVSYNTVTDGGFERHFGNGLGTGNDPNISDSVVRPRGNYINQEAAYELDKILEAATTYGVYMQMCTCINPWFTWAKNGGDTGGVSGVVDGDFDDNWMQMHWRRLFRYQVARWGWSTAVLGWEFWNEQGHINSGGTPGQWAFWGSYSPYQLAVDPYDHLRTNSQNSGAWSIGFASQPWIDYISPHNYMDGALPTVEDDESDYVMRYNECFAQWLAPGAGNACNGLNVGDGSSPSGSRKPILWGELGACLTPTGTSCDDGDATHITDGVRAVRWFTNTCWTGTVTPGYQCPIPWWFYEEDATGTAGKYAARSAVDSILYGHDRESCNPVQMYTPDDIPPNWAGAQVTTSNSTAKVYGYRCTDKTEFVWYVQHQDYIWTQCSSDTVCNTPSTISATLTSANSSAKASTVYRVTIYNPTTGAVITRTSATSNGSGALAIASGNFSTSLVIRAVEADWPQWCVNAQRHCRAVESTDGTYALTYAWIGPTILDTTISLDLGPSTISTAAHTTPIVWNGQVLTGVIEGSVYAMTLSNGAAVWNTALTDGSPILTTGAIHGGANRAVYATTAGWLYGLNLTTGAITWSADTGCATTTSPAIEDTHVYLATHCGTVLAYNVYDGTLLWTTQLNNPVDGDIAADRDNVYVGDEGMYVHKIGAFTGTVAGCSGSVGSLTCRRLHGQSFAATNPVVFNSRVWWTTVLTPGHGAEYVTSNVLDDSCDGGGPPCDDASFATEETNAALFLSGDTSSGAWPEASVDWRHTFVTDISTWTEPFNINALPVGGVGNPPDSMVVDNSDRVLTYAATAHATLTDCSFSTPSECVFGTRWGLDVFGIDQADGTFNRLGAGTALTTSNWWPWEIDNTCGLSVSGSLLFCHSRFRGVKSGNLSTSAWASIKAHISFQDGGDFGFYQVKYITSDGEGACSGSNSCSGVGSNSSGGFATGSSTIGWGHTVLVGGKLIIGEEFGFTVLQ